MYQAITPFVNFRIRFDRKLTPAQKGTITRYNKAIFGTAPVYKAAKKGEPARWTTRHVAPPKFHLNASETVPRAKLKKVAPAFIPQGLPHLSEIPVPSKAGDRVFFERVTDPNKVRLIIDNGERRKVYVPFPGDWSEMTKQEKAEWLRAVTPPDSITVAVAAGAGEFGGGERHYIAQDMDDWEYDLAEILDDDAGEVDNSAGGGGGTPAAHGCYFYSI